MFWPVPPAVKLIAPVLENPPVVLLIAPPTLNGTSVISVAPLLLSVALPKVMLLEEFPGVRVTPAVAPSAL